jgi:putative glutamine amidotransferase
MNVAYGGTLFQDLPSETGVAHTSADATVPSHEVVLQTGSLLYAIVGKTNCDVNSSHHQAVRQVGRGLLVSATAGDGTVEGIEDPARPFAVGVQWHPELIPEHANSRGLFAALVEAARKALG